MDDFNKYIDVEGANKNDPNYKSLLWAIKAEAPVFCLDNVEDF